MNDTAEKLRAYFIWSLDNGVTTFYPSSTNFARLMKRGLRYVPVIDEEEALIIDKALAELRLVNEKAHNSAFLYARFGSYTKVGEKLDPSVSDKTAKQYIEIALNEIELKLYPSLANTA